MSRQGTTLLRLVRERLERCRMSGEKKGILLESHITRPWYVFTKHISVMIVPQTTMIVGTEDIA
jgi:hypothetical protein